MTERQREIAKNNTLLLMRLDGFTQTDFVVVLGLKDRSYFSRVMRGERTFSLNLAYLVADFYGFKIEDFINKRLVTEVFFEEPEKEWFYGTTRIVI